MKLHFPRISIGLPVYNGMNYLEETIDSILNQTFTDFELIISDNASTDRTRGICQAYAAKHRHVRYVRNKENLGAARNYNRVFELASGEFFKWNGHDDPLASDFLARCVDVLDRNPSIVLCYAKTQVIDEKGAAKALHAFAVRRYKTMPKLCSPKAHKRFHQCVVTCYPPTAIFGLIRSDVLRQTPLIGSYIASDRPLLGELALHGQFYEIPELLLFRRIHTEQLSWKAYKNRRTFEKWYDTSLKKTRTPPPLRLLREYLNAIKRASSNGRTRMWCYLSMIMWMIKYPLLETPLKMVLRKLYLYLSIIDKRRKLFKLFYRRQKI